MLQRVRGEVTSGHNNEEELWTLTTYWFVTADIISCVEFNQDGELLATGDKGGRVVIFQVSYHVKETIFKVFLLIK